MTKNLLIVESPAKAKTIKKYLGPEFEIMASVGHIKDLPENRLGVEIKADFRPEYVTIKGKTKILSALRNAAKKSDAIYLGPDPDREGEAIAWHIAEELRDGGRKIFRVLFNELTAKAIREAVASPQELNESRFQSQQARRILDRLVGYQISPLLWSRVKRGLSAGRVQSVSLRMICDRERKIQAFESQEYWSLVAHLRSDEPPPFKARLLRFDGQKIELRNEDQTKKIVSEAEGRTFAVLKVKKKKKQKHPSPPFTTSLLQQEAYKRLRFSAKKTMSVAQALYEGVEIGNEGQMGLITYMRTDSFRLSDDAISQVRNFIQDIFGQEFLPVSPKRFKSPKGSQEAHEAIRPTFVKLEPESVAPYLDKDQLSLYTLIWKRSVACQMKSALLEQTEVEIKAGKATFKASGSVVVFEGFMKVYKEDPDESGPERVQEANLPPLRKGQILELLKLEPAQHFTQPPPRYTEATLIKALEENGIGRPSTYAAILANISGREYVSQDKGRFKPTELGFLISDLLVKSFPDILDTTFTAQMEDNLDKIERGGVRWTKVLKDFYASFGKDLEKAQRMMKGEVQTDLACPECRRPLAIKSGKNGLFLACTGFPECRHSANFTRDERGNIVVEETPENREDFGVCEKCGRPMIVKRGRFGPFLACSGYPECKNTRGLTRDGSSGDDNTIDPGTCKQCGGRMLLKVGPAGQEFFACENYPTCRYTKAKRTDVPCPNEDCQGMLVERMSRKGRRFYACDQYPKCKFAMWEEPFEGVCPECGARLLRVKYPKNAEPFAGCRSKHCKFKKPLQAALSD